MSSGKKQKRFQQSDIATKIMNQCISKSIFPSELKLADVSSFYKRKSKNSKDNYIPIYILSNISKIYERCIYDQIQLFFDSILLKYQYGFRRVWNAQHCSITLIEKWKKSFNDASAFGALLTDLSKAFDCWYHELLSFKPHEFFKINAQLPLKQKTKSKNK